MKKWILLSIMLGAASVSLQAQDDDMYFVPTKQNVARDRAAYYGTSAYDRGYYSGSSRSVDEYNRRWTSQYEVLPADTGDIVSFAPVEGVYPDSLGDYELTQRMARFDGYEPSSDYWAGYAQGQSDSWGWHSPWYYSSYYPWYDSYWYWNDPWYWDYGWYNPWYYRGWGWGGYYSSWYYRPWHYGYYWGGGGGYAYRTSPGTHNHGHIVGAGPQGHGATTGSFGGSRRTGFGSSRTTSTATRSASTGFGSSRTTTSGSSTFGGSRTRTTVSSSSSGSSSYGSFGGSSSGSSYTPSRSTSSSSGSSMSSGGGSFGGSRTSGGGGGGGTRSGGGGFGGSRR